jgi:leader peptidase (prepilin peptidase)/N-methyltransferase
MIEAILAFVAGLLVGSFLNVCIYRMPRDLSVVTPRSFCPACRHTVAWYDNIPVLSYALLRGHCRHCGQPISIRYPAVELITALIFFGVVQWQGLSLESAKLCVFAVLLVGLVFADLEERILPDEFTLGGAALGVVLAALVPFDVGIFGLLMPMRWNRAVVSVVEAVLSGAMAAGLLWVTGWLYRVIRKREGIGLGDIKMVAMIGAFLGLQGALITIVLASMLGSVVGLIYIYATRKEASTYELPFGSFLGVAALGFALLRGQFFIWLERLYQ